MIKKRYLLIVFVVSFIVSFVLFNVPTTAKIDKKTKIYIYPKRSSYPKLGIGDTFETNVKIDDVDNLYAYEFRLKYDPEILEFVEISSSFLSGFKIKKTDEAGVIRYASASMYPAKPKTGDGILATITFKIKGIGESVLDIYNSKLADYDIKWINHFVKDGYFSNEKDEKDENEVEIEWEENIVNVGFSTEVSGLESIINMELSEIIYQESPECVDADVDTFNCTGEEAGCGPLDCNDTNPLTYPGATEICDRKDNDCNNHTDEPDVCCAGDANHKIDPDSNNYTVDIFDLALIGKSYGSMRGQERYDECTNITEGYYCDLNDDGFVNIFDLAKVGKNYGNACLACIHVTIHVQDEFDQPIDGAYVKIITGTGFFVEEESTDIYGNYETETCLEDGPYMYEMTTPIGCYKFRGFYLPDDTYVLVEPPWDSCPY